MRAFFLLVVLLLCTGIVFAQPRRKDLTKAFSSAERKAILAALKLALEPQLRLKASFVVTSLVTKNNFAFFQGAAKNPSGKGIDFRKTVYKEAVEQGMFDGDGTTALLKKTKGKWQVVQFTIGPTDVPWGCWWKEFSAPKDIFNYVEKTCIGVDAKK